MKRLLVVAVLGSGAILGSACQTIVGIEDRTESSSLSDDAGVADAPSTPVTDAGSDGPPTLAPDAAPPAGCPVGCLPPAPGGWIGPSAVYQGSEAGKPASCPATYTQQEVDAHVGMTAAPATCGCGAPTITGAKCSAKVVTYPDSLCAQTGTIDGTASSNASCYATTNAANARYKVQPPVLTPGTCSFPNPTKDVPAPTFASVELACGLAQPSACTARADCVATPAPAQPFTKLCIHADGDVSCPSQDYSQRFVAFKKIDDTRSCTACAATPTGGTCGTQWGTQSALGMCGSALPPTDKTVGTCYAYPGPGLLVDVNAMGPTGTTCPPTGGAPSGAATDAEPVTFCCTP